MIVGVPKETKADENRVALLPVGARQLVEDGHQVLIEAGAGRGSGLSDADFQAAGATLVATSQQLFDQAELLVKVKEPQPQEVAQLQPRHTVFGYFHFAGDRALTEGCLRAGFTALAYETLVGSGGDLPLLTPMSEVAGKLSVQAGAKILEQPSGGRGVLLGGVTGVAPAHVVVLGGGVVGRNAALMAAGLGADVRVLDVNLATLRQLQQSLPANVVPLYSDPQTLEREVVRADLVIGAVLLPGKTAPHLISRALLKKMKPQSVVVDVCIDQGGCLETSRPTSHAAPTFEEHDVIHYCVTNMPAAVSRTSTQALCNATFRYVRHLARMGADAFCAQDRGQQAALNLKGGQIVHPAVAEAFGDLPHCG